MQATLAFAEAGVVVVSSGCPGQPGGARDQPVSNQQKSRFQRQPSSSVPIIAPRIPKAPHSPPALEVPSNVSQEEWACEYRVLAGAGALATLGLAIGWSREPQNPSLALGRDTGLSCPPPEARPCCLPAHRPTSAPSD